jgi:hypothetical protein
MVTDTSEKGLETLIMRHMTGTDGLASATGHKVATRLPRESDEPQENDFGADADAAVAEDEPEAIAE